jgi:hypothetical protein
LGRPRLQLDDEGILEGIDADEPGEGQKVPGPHSQLEQVRLERAELVGRFTREKQWNWRGN